MIEPQFDWAEPFFEGLAPVIIGGERGKYGYIDKKGQFVINPQFDEAESFFEGLAYVRIGEKVGYIDKTGNIIYSWEEEDITDEELKEELAKATEALNEVLTLELGEE